VSSSRERNSSLVVASSAINNRKIEHDSKIPQLEHADVKYFNALVLHIKEQIAQRQYNYAQTTPTHPKPLLHPNSANFLERETLGSKPACQAQRLEFQAQRLIAIAHPC